MHDPRLYLLVVLAIAVLGAIERLINGRGDRKLTRHFFDQTRSTKELEPYVKLVKARRSGFNRIWGLFKNQKDDDVSS